MPAAELELERDPEVSRARRHHAEYLAFALIALLGCALLSVGEESVTLAGGWSLPPLCGSQLLAGVSCPGCGLTRGVVSLTHGEVARSLAFHPLSPLMLLFIVWQLPYRAWMLRRGEWLPPPRLARLHGWAGNLTIAALIVTWLIRTTLD